MSEFKFTKYEQSHQSNTTDIEEVRLQDGQSATLAFTGARAAFDSVFDEGRNRLATEDAYRRGLPIKKRVLLTALDLSNGRHVFVDLAVYFYDQIVDQWQTAPPPRWAWSYRRVGVGKDTKYLIEPARPLTPRELADRDALPTVEPKHLIEQKYGSVQGTPQRGREVSRPVVERADRIGRADVVEIEQALGGLAPEVLTNFLETFGVAAIDELSVAMTAAAIRYALALAADHQPAAPTLNNNIF